MKLAKHVIGGLAIIMCAALALAQAGDGNRFTKDGLSFDYPAGWHMDDQSNSQIQYLTLTKDGYAELIVRSPRATIDSPEKEAEAKRLIQDGYIDAWAKNFESTRAKVERTTMTTNIAGAPGDCTRLKASLADGPGHVDICWRLIEKRMAQVAIVGSDKDINRTSQIWDALLASVKIEAPVLPTPVKTKPKA
jgi:hypothetical protein